MSHPFPEMAQILATLAASPLSAISTVAIQAVSSVPENSVNTADSRYSVALEQIKAVRSALIFPLERELESLNQLPGLAKYLGLSPHIMVMNKTDESGQQNDELTSRRRREALSSFIQILSGALSDAAEAAYKREFGR